MATFDDWLAMYQQVYASPEEMSSASCVNCGTKGLNLVLVVRRVGADQGWAAFWCGRCMTGTALDRAEVPPDMRSFVTGDDAGAVTKVIPSYRLIPPTPTAVDEE
jgi:hypothetical protein